MRSSTFLTLWLFICFSFPAFSQATLDTIAYQDFETSPATPTWNYTGTLANTLSGYASASASIPNTPLGIGGSRAWHVASVSSGNNIVFNNTVIPTGYDSVFVSFRLAGLSLTSSTGGPDNLDYVLVAYSLDGGANYVDRVRVRGATTNNSSWPYSAATEAIVDYLPATETVFQPTSSGVQLQDGIGYVQIKFPGSISQLALEITPRSSSSSDNWLIDDLLLVGKQTCSNSTSSLSATVCDSYTAPSGNVLNATGTYTDVIPNASGCDSIISINLTVNQSTGSTDAVASCDPYTWIDGNTYSNSNNTATMTYTNSIGCDSVVTLNLTILPNQNTTDAITACDAYTWLDGNTYTSSNNTATMSYTNSFGCDSVVTLNLTILNSANSTDVISACESYTWIDGNTYTSSNNTATQLLTSSNGCDSTVLLDLTILNPSSTVDNITACEAYTWVDGNTYTASNNTATYTSTNQNGCDSVVTLNLTINQVSDLTVSLDGITLAANNTLATSFQWLDCNNNYGPVSGATNSTLTAPYSGDFAVEITENGCVDTSDCVTVLNVGTHDLSGFSSFEAFVVPNPNKSSFQMKHVEGDELRIFDLSSRLVSQFTQIVENQVFSPELEAGVYIVVELKNAKSVRQQKMIVL